MTDLLQQAGDARRLTRDGDAADRPARGPRHPTDAIDEDR